MLSRQNLKVIFESNCEDFHWWTYFMFENGYKMATISSLACVKSSCESAQKDIVKLIMLIYKELWIKPQTKQSKAKLCAYFMEYTATPATKTINIISIWCTAEFHNNFQFQFLKNTIGTRFNKLYVSSMFYLCCCILTHWPLRDLNETLDKEFSS